MRRTIQALVLVLVVVAAVFSLGTGGELAGQVSVRGKELYQKKCAVCHGTEGRGDGPAAYLLYPRPRDLTSGKFKIRSTPTLPTDEDLLRTITTGIPGTSMPSWGALPEQDRTALVAYVKGLSDRFAEAGQRPISIPEPPRRTPALAALGKDLYAEAGCLECHGPKGRGDGSSAPTLKDDLGYPIVPYDFTVPGRMKGGSTLKDIYRTLTTGIGGTPMPSYADSLDERQRWAIAYYVLSLARGREEQVPDTAALTSRFVSSALPLDPASPLWAKAPARAVRLRTLWQRPKTIETLSVQSLHNGSDIAFLLEWKDSIADQAVLRSEDFRDAAAIQFPVADVALHGAEHAEPSYTMGDSGLVNIWHWKADWEVDLARFRDIQDRYPGMAADAYLFRKGAPPGESSAETVKAPTATHDSTYLTGWGAGNLLSSPSRSSSVEDLNAKGLGTLTSQPPDDQNVRGKGIWREGRWRVVFIRAMRSPSERDVQLTPGQSLPLAFALWDGAQGDRDGQKAVSTWQTITLEEGRP